MHLFQARRSITFISVHTESASVAFVCGDTQCRGALIRFIPDLHAAFRDTYAVKLKVKQLLTNLRSDDVLEYAGQRCRAGTR